MTMDSNSAQAWSDSYPWSCIQRVVTTEAYPKQLTTHLLRGRKQDQQQKAMSLEAYPPRNPNGIHTDVLAEARQACYKARDAFYACLEKESDKKPTEIASVGLLYASECKSSRVEFVKQCRGSWVNHFDRQYCRNKRVQRLLDDKEARRGPLSLPQPYTFKPPAS